MNKSEMKNVLLNNAYKSLQTKIISQEYNDLFFEKSKNILSLSIGRIIIKNNSVEIILSNTNIQASIFKQVLEQKIKSLIHQIPDNFEFFTSFNDGCVHYPSDCLDMIEKHIIMLTPYSIIGRDNIEILIPDFYMMQERYRFEFVETYINNIPFQNRIPVAKFRGSQTGGVYNMQGIEKCTIPRLKGVFLSLQYPQFLDIRFINSYNIQCNDKKYIEQMTEKFGPVSNLEPMKNFNKNRYLLCFDGNMAPPFARPETIMISGSVPLIQTNYNKYWGCFLIDNVNYFKINYDLSNLINAVDYLNKNYKFAETIAKNARELAEVILMPNFQDEYFVDILKIVAKYKKSTNL